MMTLVYRLERADGTGPYQHRWEQEWPLGEPNFLRELYREWERDGLPDPHPAPRNDGLPRGRMDELFGFHSVELFKAWMARDPEDLRQLEAAGFRVTLYRVPDKHSRIGGRQCTFVLKFAQAVKAWRPTELIAVFPGLFHDQVPA